MSLVNRMLKDLSAREPTSANVMQGIRLEGASSSGGSRRPMYVLLLALLAGGAAWWWFGQRAAPAAIASKAPAAAPIAAGSATEAAAPAPANAPISRFILDESLSAVPVPRANTRPARSRAPTTDLAPAPAASSSAPSAQRPISSKAVGRLDDSMGVIEHNDRRLAARLALEQNRPAEAIAQLEIQPLPSVRDDAEYNGLLASAYQRMNRHADASRLYRALASDQPEQGHWWAGYAISREALGDLVEAQRAYAQALQDQRLDPSVSRYVRGRLEALNTTAG